MTNASVSVAPVERSTLQEFKLMSQVANFLNEECVLPLEDIPLLYRPLLRPLQVNHTVCEGC